MLALFLLLTTLAVAGGVPGWTEGPVAARTPQVLAGLEEPVRVDLPRSIRDRIEGPTFLVYFSPTCPHCQQAQPELNALARQVRGRAAFLGVASGSATQRQAREFQRRYEVAYPVVHDAERVVAGAIGARSTPSIALVVPDGRKRLITHAWYPYRRGTGPLLQMAVSDDPWSVFAEGAYQGNAVCSACHTHETASWMLSHHSIAWETLQARAADTEPACVGCHVTGHGQPTGWTAGQDHLVDVGCESCHGPAGPHDGSPTEARATCVGCHDEKHSIAFSVDKGLPHIDHFESTALSDEAFRERLQALHTGQAARPLLAFAEGDHVGSQACATCHGEAHAWWSKDPHGEAMASLAGKTHEGAPAAEQVACVRCHASPTRHGGPAPTRLDQYALYEGGVGCESCHGPGGKHVESGGAPGTIEGLGEDCPVCVLEALCTGCHTATWDPGWDLDARLGSIGHGGVSVPDGD